MEELSSELSPTGISRPIDLLQHTIEPTDPSQSGRLLGREASYVCCYRRGACSMFIINSSIHESYVENYLVVQYIYDTPFVGWSPLLSFPNTGLSMLYLTKHYVCRSNHAPSTHIHIYNMIDIKCLYFIDSVALHNMKSIASLSKFPTTLRDS